jgi:hypothetical protein
MQKALMQMNVQLHHAVSDITGVTGLSIVRAIISGERDPSMLIQYRDVRCKKTPEVLRQALTGNWQPEHLFALEQSVAFFDFYQEKIRECDDQIETSLLQLSTGIEEPEGVLPSARHRTKQPNQLSFDVRPLLWKITGADLTQIHGFGPYLALKFIAECGTDMNRWPDASHFTSWLCLSREIRSPVEKCCPRKHGVHPVELLPHSDWQPQQLAGAIPRWALLSSIIIPYRESKSSHCNGKKTGNTVLQCPEVWTEICRSWRRLL